MHPPAIGTAMVAALSHKSCPPFPPLPTTWPFSNMERVSIATVLGSCTPEKAKDNHTLIFLFFFLFLKIRRHKKKKSSRTKQKRRKITERFIIFFPTR
jgi:hypothetical protein